MPFFCNQAFLLVIALVMPAVPQEQPSGNNGIAPSLENRTLGSFDAKNGGSGFVLYKGDLFIEAMVINKDLVEFGIFQVDTCRQTGCILESFFAEKLKILGLGNVTLKFGNEEIPGIKATVLDHPELKQAFKDNAPLFKNLPLCGVIGYPALAARKTVLDFQTFTAYFLPPNEKKKADDPSPSSEKKLVFPYKADLHVLRAEVNINDKVEASFLIDTCLAFSWITKGIGQKAGIRKGKSPQSFKVGGAELSPMPVGLRSLEKPDLDERFVKAGINGSLGCDFLIHYKVTIDAVNGEVLLEPFPKAP